MQLSYSAQLGKAQRWVFSFVTIIPFPPFLHCFRHFISEQPPISGSPSGLVVAKNAARQSGKIPLGADGGREGPHWAECVQAATHRGIHKAFPPPFPDTQGCLNTSLKAEGGLANILLGTEGVDGALLEQGCEFGPASVSPLSACSHHPGPPFYSFSKHLLITCYLPNLELGSVILW